MIPKIDIRHDLAGLEARLGLMASERMPAAVRAINRTITTVRAQAARDLQKEYPGLKIGKIKTRMRMHFARRDTPTAALVFSGKRFELYGNFTMRAVGNWGVRFARLPWRIETVSGDPVSAEMLARAFRNRGRSGGRPRVMSRRTRVRTSNEVLVAPGLARALTERRIVDAMTRLARQRFAVVFVQEAKFRLSRR